MVISVSSECENNIKGESQLDLSKYPPALEFPPTHATFWEEHLFISDHGDSPKVI